MVTKKGSTEKGISSYSGLISYVLGIVAIVEAFVSPFAGLILSIIGLVFSKKENSEFSYKGKRLNIIALIVSIVVLALTIFLAYNASSIIGA